ncbi:hypothetical protein KQ693_10895 [Thermus sp. PS18]|uniref:hypothetical protein n=1 Tax=Thermus sp. PS18 TaxID=2849039 RepID=UPI002264F3A4|nr:hypothetical protein [Thermus sp. PS18]UZX15119.1 hypothetical protein KQ693_10895 [Thermus sp. PS18]
MRRVVLALLLFVLGSSLAQSSGYGLYSGFPTYLGLQYQSANVRFGVGLSGYGFGGDVGLILAKSPLPAAPGVSLDWYYGAGFGLGFWTVLSYSGFYLFPHGLVGVEYRFPEMPFSAYGELNLGVGIGLGSLAGWRGIGPDFAGRVGIIFH